MQQHVEAGGKQLSISIEADGVRQLTKPETNVPVSEVGLTRSVSFHNWFPYPMVVTDRSGMSFELPPNKGNWRPNKDFRIVVHYQFARDVKIDIHHILDEVDDKSHPQLRALKHAVENSRSNVTCLGHDYFLEFTVSRSTFESNNFAVYLDDLDIVLNRASPSGVATLHPESRAGRLLREQIDSESFGGLSYRIEINDPDKKFGKRYININGRIYTIKPTVDLTKPEGVYVHTPEELIKPNQKVVNFFPFESADAELMLFRTALDASNLGNQSEVRKRELEDLQHQQRLDLLQKEKDHKEALNELEFNLAKIKEEKSQREAFLEQQNASLKAEAAVREARLAEEKAYREARLMSVKDHYESRSYERKDSSEIIKWLPAIAGGIIGAGVLILKYVK